MPMGNACFTDGSPQPLYFPPDPPTHPGLFKGMAVILEECGYVSVHNICAECVGFKCPKDPDGEHGRCCCRCILFNEPDFVNVPSLLSSLCAKNSVPAIFLPKFSPELNPIEQCWGYAKRIYREFPPSSAIEDVIKMLERHSLLSLWNAFRSELTPSTPPCIALTVSTGSEIGLSVMRIVTRKFLMAVNLLGQAATSTVTVRFPILNPRK